MSAVSGRSVATLAVAAILVTVVAGSWSLRRSTDLVRSERTRLQALVDSLRSEVLLEPRLRILERRLNELETGVSIASDAVRPPEVIALRDWSRRLEARVEANRRRITRNERHIDSLWIAAPSRDILTLPEARE